MLFLFFGCVLVFFSLGYCFFCWLFMAVAILLPPNGMFRIRFLFLGFDPEWNVFFSAYLYGNDYSDVVCDESHCHFSSSHIPFFAVELVAVSSFQC